MLSARLTSVCLLLGLSLLAVVAVPGWRVDPMIAAAPEEGETGAADAGPQPVVYTALGDSIATGVFSAAGYVPIFADHLSEELGQPVQLTNLAVNGWTSADLLRALRTNQAYRSAVQAADVITINIGGNDLLRARAQYVRGSCGDPENTGCLTATTEQVRANWEAILDEILALVDARSVAIRTMNVYNPYPAADAAHLPVLQPYLEIVNADLCGAAEQRGMSCARVYEAFNGGSGVENPVERALISLDGLHPSSRGHALIADLLRDLGYSPLR